MNWLKENMILIILALLIGGTAFYFLVLHPKLRVTTAPELVDAVVVVKTNDRDYATNEPLQVTPEQEPQLQAVVIARKHGEREATYFSMTPKLKIDGKMIPEERIEPWDTFKWKEIRILWFKVEPVVMPKYENEPFDYSHLEYKYQFQADWPLTWTHPLDVTGFAQSYPRQNFGTMRFYIRAEIKTSMVNVVQKVYSPGHEAVDDRNILSGRVFTVQMVPSDDLFGQAVALFNLAYVRNMDWTRLGDENPIERLLAVDGVDYFIHAARRTGLDIPYGKPDALLNHIHPVIPDVHLDTKTRQYVDGSGKPILTERLKKGMFFVQGDKVAMYAGEGSFEAGKLHVLSADDRVLYAPDLPLYYEPAGSHFERTFFIGELR